MEKNLNDIIKNLMEIYKDKKQAEKGILEITELRNKVIYSIEYNNTSEVLNNLKNQLDNKLIAMCQLIKELPDQAPEQKEIDELKRKLEINENHMEYLDQANKRACKEISKLRNENSELKKNLEHCKDSIDVLLEVNTEYKEDIEYLKNHGNDLCDESFKIVQDLNNEIEQLKKDNKKLKNKIEYYESEINHKDIILNQYSSELLKSKYLIKEIKDIKFNNSIIKSHNRKLKKVNERLNAGGYEKDIKDLKYHIRLLNREIRELNIELDKIKNHNKDCIDRITKKDNEILDLRLKLSSYENI